MKSKKIFYLFKQPSLNHYNIYVGYCVEMVKANYNVEILTYISVLTYFKNLKLYRSMKSKYGVRYLKISFIPTLRRLEILQIIFRLFVNKWRYKEIMLIARKIDYTTLKYIKKLVPSVILLYECEGDAISEHKYIKSYDASFPLEPLEETYKENNNIFKISDMVIAGTESMVTLLRMRYPVLNGKITYAIPTFSKKSFYFDEGLRRTKREALNVQNRKVFIYCGDIGYPWQNIETVLNIFAKVKKIREDAFFILLVHKSQQALAKKLMADFNIEEKDYLAGSVSNTEVAEYLMAADIGFVLRDIYTFNYVAPTAKTGEYLATGLPVIYTKALKLYNSFIEEIGHCLTEYRKEEFLNRIDEIANYSVENEQRAKVSELAIEKYSFESNAAQYAAIVKEAFKKNS